MPDHFVVIGSGIAGVTCAEELSKLNQYAYITLLTLEDHGYYSRPLLSHGFTRADIETKIILKTFSAIVSHGISVEAGAEVLSLDRSAKTLRYRQKGREKTLGYDKLILATGSDAFIPPPFLGQEKLFHCLNSLSDLIELRKLRAKLQTQTPKPRWAVVGGGLIGCEIAADLAKAGDSVTLFHALPRLMERQLVEEDSIRLLQHLQSALGIEVKLSQDVRGFAETPSARPETSQLALQVAEESIAGFHGILVACGFKPRIALAQNSGLASGRGISVNDFLTTEDSSVFAIGDCAQLPDGRIYAYVTPVRHQALWLAKHLSQSQPEPWAAPAFKPKAKIPGFEAAQPYLF